MVSKGSEPGTCSQSEKNRHDRQCAIPIKAHQKTQAIVRSHQSVHGDFLSPVDAARKAALRA
jgi:hypothetical protein